MKAVTLLGSWCVTGLLVTGLSLMGQSQVPIQARDTLNQGVSAFRNGDYQSAIELFKQAVDLDPSFPTAELYLATAYAQAFVPGVKSSENLARADNAIESFRRVIQQDPNNTMAMLGLAAVYQNTEKLQDAHDTFLTVAKLEPKNPLAFYSVGAIDWLLVFDKKNPLSFGQKSVLIEEGLSDSSRVRLPLIRQVPPVYPQAARDSRIQGVVVLEASVKKDGLVEDLKVINGHPLLIQAAIDAVRQRIYKPMLINGQPDGFVTTITVPFALPQ